MMLFATVYAASKDTEKADIIRSPFLFSLFLVRAVRGVRTGAK